MHTNWCILTETKMETFWAAIIESCELKEEFSFRIKVELFCTNFIKTLNLARKVGRQCLTKNCIELVCIAIGYYSIANWDKWNSVSEAFFEKVRKFQKEIVVSQIKDFFFENWRQHSLILKLHDLYALSFSLTL